MRLPIVGAMKASESLGDERVEHSQLRVAHRGNLRAELAVLRSRPWCPEAGSLCPTLALMCRWQGGSCGRHALLPALPSRSGRQVPCPCLSASMHTSVVGVNEARERSLSSWRWAELTRWAPSGSQNVAMADERSPLQHGTGLAVLCRAKHERRYLRIARVAVRASSVLQRPSEDSMPADSRWPPLRELRAHGKRQSIASIDAARRSMHRAWRRVLMHKQCQCSRWTLQTKHERYAAGCC